MPSPQHTSLCVSRQQPMGHDQQYRVAGLGQLEGDLGPAFPGKREQAGWVDLEDLSGEVVTGVHILVFPGRRSRQRAKIIVMKMEIDPSAGDELHFSFGEPAAALVRLREPGPYFFYRGIQAAFEPDGIRRKEGSLLFHIDYFF